MVVRRRTSLLRLRLPSCATSPGRLLSIRTRVVALRMLCGNAAFASNLAPL